MLDLVNTFRALSDETRLRLLFLLTSGPKNVTSLTEELGLKQPTTSHHLGILRTLRIVRADRRGKEVYYALDTASVSLSKKASAIEMRCGDRTLYISRSA